MATKQPTPTDEPAPNPSVTYHLLSDEYEELLSALQRADAPDIPRPHVNTNEATNVAYTGYLTRLAAAELAAYLNGRDDVSDGLTGYFSRLSG